MRDRLRAPPCAAKTIIQNWPGITGIRGSLEQQENQSMPCHRRDCAGTSSTFDLGCAVTWRCNARSLLGKHRTRASAARHGCAVLPTTDSLDTSDGSTCAVRHRSLAARLCDATSSATARGNRRDASGTVSGLTIAIASRTEGNNRLSKTKSARSVALRRNFGAVRRITLSCCLSATFSASISATDRNRFRIKQTRRMTSARIADPHAMIPDRAQIRPDEVLRKHTCSLAMPAIW